MPVKRKSRFGDNRRGSFSITQEVELEKSTYKEKDSRPLFMKINEETTEIRKRQRRRNRKILPGPGRPKLFGSSQLLAKKVDSSSSSESFSLPSLSSSGVRSEAIKHAAGIARQRGTPGKRPGSRMAYSASDSAVGFKPGAKKGAAGLPSPSRSTGKLSSPLNKKTTQANMLRSLHLSEEEFEDVFGIGSHGDEGTIYGDVAYENKMKECTEQVLAFRKEFNQLTYRHTKMKSKVKALEDELRNIEREDDVEKTRNERMKAIKHEKEVLDALQKKKEEISCYRKTLTIMVDRLKTGRLNFDNTIKAYEDALAVRRVEEEETRRMTAEVYQAMTEEQKELTRLEGLANKERIMWDDELKMRRQLVEKRKEMIRWYEERTKSDMEAEALANGDMTREDEENMKKRKAVTALKLETVETKLHSTRGKIQKYEDAFQKIRLATGLIEESDIIRRYINRTDQMKSADDDNKRMRAEIERLTELCDETKLEIDELKYSGAGLSDGFNREEVDHKTDALDAMRKMLKNKRMDCTAARSVVVEIEQCISGILERLEALRVESSPKAHHHHHPQHQHEDGDNDDDEELEDGIAGGVSAANSVMVFSHRPGSPNHEPHVDGGNDPSEKLGHIEMRTKELIQDLRDMERYADTHAHGHGHTHAHGHGEFRKISSFTHSPISLSHHFGSSSTAAYELGEKIQNKAIHSADELITKDENNIRIKIKGKSDSPPVASSIAAVSEVDPKEIKRKRSLSGELRAFARQTNAEQGREEDMLEKVVTRDELKTQAKTILRQGTRTIKDLPKSLKFKSAVL